MDIKTVEQFVEALETKYVWPGGYPIHFITEDCACLCYDCANKEREIIIDAIATADRNGWLVMGADVNWESYMTCDHCSQQIEAAYAVKWCLDCGDPLDSESKRDFCSDRCEDQYHIAMGE